MVKQFTALFIVVFLVVLVIVGITFLYIIMIPPPDIDNKTQKLTNDSSNENILQKSEYEAFLAEYNSLPLQLQTFLSYVKIISKYPTMNLYNIVTHANSWKTLMSTMSARVAL